MLQNSNSTAIYLSCLALAGMLIIGGAMIASDSIEKNTPSRYSLILER